MREIDCYQDMKSPCRLTSRSPIYDAVTGDFHQFFDYVSPVRIDGDHIGKVIPHAERLFRGVIEMNNLRDYAWPPHVCEAVPNADFKSAVILLATKASAPRIIAV